MNLTDLYKIAKRNITHPTTLEAIWELMTVNEQKNYNFDRQKFMDWNNFIAAIHESPFVTIEAPSQAYDVTGKNICAFSGLCKSILFK